MNGRPSDNIRLLCLGAICAACAGCGAYKAYEAYDGPERPPDQTATVRPTCDSKDDSFLDIRRIDGRSVYIKPEGPLYPHQMVIEPGEHVLVVAYLKSGIPGTTRHYKHAPDIQVKITAEAGHNYEVKYQVVSQNSICVWAEDAETNEFVSSIVMTRVAEFEPWPIQPVPIPIPAMRR